MELGEAAHHAAAICSWLQCSGLSQELVDKHTELPNDIQWHFIGHLQSRKSKQLLGRLALGGVLSIECNCG